MGFDLGSITNIAGDLFGANNAGVAAQQQKDAATQGAAAADPFASQRGQYQKQLSDLMSDPGGQLAKTPGYQAGMDSVQRSLLAQGYQGSGLMMQNMLQYGGSIFNQQVSQLGKLAGVDSSSPATAGQIIQKGAASAGSLNAQSSSSLMSGISGIANLFGGGGAAAGGGLVGGIDLAGIGGGLGGGTAGATTWAGADIGAAGGLGEAWGAWIGSGAAAETAVAVAETAAVVA